MALRVSLIVSPRPLALLARRVFASGSEQVAQTLGKYAPPNVVALPNLRFGDEEDMLLDVVYLASVAGQLVPLIWVHGVAGMEESKDELTSYFKLIASHGYLVVAPRYAGDRASLPHTTTADHAGPRLAASQR